MLTNIEIGARIKMARENKKYTLEDVAKELGMNKSTIQRYESGRVEKIKLPVIEAMGKILEVNPSWLIGKSENKEIKDKSSVLLPAYLSFAKNAQDNGILPEDIEMALNMIKKLKKGSENK